MDILSGILEGLNQLKNSTGMDISDIRFRIISLLNTLIQVDPEKRIELLSIDEDFCNAVDASVLTKSRRPEVRDTVSAFCATLIQYNKELSASSFSGFDIESRDMIQRMQMNHLWDAIAGIRKKHTTAVTQLR